MADDFLSKLIASLSGPSGGNGHNKGTDAPGSNSRRDLTTPDGPGVVPDSGKGQPDVLGYHMHGDAPDAEAGTRAMEIARRRHPDLAHGGRPGPAVPDYNRYYDQFRSDDGYDKLILNTAHGAWVVGTTASQPVVLDNPANLRLAQFPGAVMVHPVLLLFTFSQSVITATGQYTMEFVPLGGDFKFPLGEYNAALAQAYNSQRWIIPSVITDPFPTVIGTFIITSTGVVGTPTILWRMGIGWAYDLPAPAYKGYIPLEAGIWQRSGSRREGSD